MIFSYWRDHVYNKYLNPLQHTRKYKNYKQIQRERHGKHTTPTDIGARCSSVARVVGSILHGVDPLSYFSFQLVLHEWCNKGRGMYYSVYGMVHIKEPLLLIGKSSPCGGSGFPLSLSEWSFTKCPTPYNRK